MEELFKFNGYKDREYELGLDWEATDEDGRAGVVVGVHQTVPGEYRITVRTSEGFNIVLDSRKISFVYPPEV